MQMAHFHSSPLLGTTIIFKRSPGRNKPISEGLTRNKCYESSEDPNADTTRVVKKRDLMGEKIGTHEKGKNKKQQSEK